MAHQALRIVLASGFPDRFVRPRVGGRLPLLELELVAFPARLGRLVHDGDRRVPIGLRLFLCLLRVIPIQVLDPLGARHAGRQFRQRLRPLLTALRVAAKHQRAEDVSRLARPDENCLADFFRLQERRRVVPRDDDVHARHFGRQAARLLEGLMRERHHQVALGQGLGLALGGDDRVFHHESRPPLYRWEPVNAIRNNRKDADRAAVQPADAVRRDDELA